MEEKKNDFKSRALSHIPLELQSSMLKEVKVDTEGFSGILEAIAKNTPKSSPLPQSKVEATQQEQFISLAIDGHVIKVSSDPVKGAITLLLYLLSTVWSKDKKVEKVLKQFKGFSFSDANGEILYPKKKVKRNG